ncbi:MAG: three-Cys-motif partner protein TcmP [Egibacteraceae bacterium]
MSDDGDAYDDDLKMAPQTEAKHRILRGYLDAWYPILGRRRQRLLYFDGLAGSGRYTTGEMGSPLVALDALLNRRDTADILAGCEFRFVFCETKKKHADRLRTRVAAYLDGRLPAGARVEWEVINSPFAAVAQEMIEMLRRQRAVGAPTLALIDPYGVKGIRMDQVAELLSFDGCELIANFAIQSASRWTDHDAFETPLDELLGTPEWHEAKQMDTYERRAFLIDLYAEQLRRVAEFKYVQAFRMWSMSGQPCYDLVYATRHPTGLSKMKEAMWKVDPGGGYEFRARLGGQQVLFSRDNVDTRPLQEAILERFAGQTVSVQRLKEFVVCDTPFLEGHLKTRALKLMEAEHVSDVSVPGKERRKGSFPDNSYVTFREAAT